MGEVGCKCLPVSHIIAYVEPRWPGQAWYRRVLTILAPGSDSDTMARAALGEHLIPFCDPRREVLFSRLIYSVEPHERVWTDTSVTPVPGFGDGLQGT